MHAVMTMTAKHDRFLSASPNSEETTIETYHSYQAAALFNRKLSVPIQPSDCDAIWATAGLLGFIAISSIEASSPEEAWPLGPSRPSDLQWLRFNTGKKAVWRIADPLRPESVFHGLLEGCEQNLQASGAMKPGIEGFSSQLATLCGLDGLSNPGKNSYYAAVRRLITLLTIDCNHSSSLKFLFFISDMQTDFICLLERKDPRALLLLVVWYAKVCHYQWWIARRAMLECRAICIYLEKYYASETAIQELLYFPKMRCELSV